MTRNLVVCLDGTGNEVGENISNVLKLFRALRKTPKTEPRQIVFYHPGVGTLARPDPWRRGFQNALVAFGLATGWGLDEQILAGYRFLVDNYQQDDRIFLFGFSRGAYAARALAGMIHMVGLPRSEQCNLADAALHAYRQTPESADLTPPAADLADERDDAEPIHFERANQAAQFARIVSTRWPTVAFLGVWDSVSSVIAPQPERFYLPTLQTLPFTLRNPSVKVFRQALAIDERRRMFRPLGWGAGQTYRSNRFSQTNVASPQDARQVWFAGVHSDIGGGYPEAESALSKYPLLWMIDAARAQGLSFDPRAVNQLAWGAPRQGSPYSYVAPEPGGALHDSMTRGWRPLEYLPKPDRYKEWPKRRSSLGRYLPLCEPRKIPDDAIVHESVELRRKSTPSYRPENFPDNPKIEPLSVRG
jgi:uncharacterized protein (DUF2235 family)